MQDLFKTARGAVTVRAEIPDRERFFWAVVNGWGAVHIIVTAGKQSPSFRRLLCGPFRDRAECEAGAAAEMAGEV